MQTAKELREYKNKRGKEAKGVISGETCREGRC